MYKYFIKGYKYCYKYFMIGFPLIFMAFNSNPVYLVRCSIFTKGTHFSNIIVIVENLRKICNPIVTMDYLLLL